MRNVERRCGYPRGPPGSARKDRKMQMGRVHRKEFDDVLRCTDPWNACGVDSVYSFPIKKCPPIKKAVFELVRKLVEWRVTDAWDEENNWLLEGRPILIFKGGDRKDPPNYRPITCLPTITKMVTLAIHKRMRRWFFVSTTKAFHRLVEVVACQSGCELCCMMNRASGMCYASMTEMTEGMKRILIVQRGCLERGEMSEDMSCPFSARNRVLHLHSARPRWKNTEPSMLNRFTLWLFQVCRSCLLLFRL